MTFRVLWWTLLFSLQPVLSLTQDTARVITAVRLEADERIRLDGVLDDPVWERIPAASAFLQQEPREGAPPTERTEVRVAYDRDHLYLAG